MNPIILAVIIVGVIGVIAGVGLSIASVALEVPVDEKVEKAREALPGANCGGCGYSGCDAYAEAVAEGRAETTLCAPGGADTAKALAEITGGSGEFVKKVAYVLCNGGCENTTKKYEYRGVGTCATVNALIGGDNSCSFGCLGRGDCVSACDEKGVFINENGIAEIDSSSCIGCGKCSRACPRGIIKLLPEKEKQVVVKCNNKDKGAIARKVCKVACIGCGICLKNCESEAITLDKNLATIDPAKCTGCGKCMEKCPQKCIVIE